MTNEQLAQLAVEALKKEYPKAYCSLQYQEPLQLLIATRLSAQCTDARVNLVAPTLFQRFKNVDEFASALPDEVEPYIKSCGFYRTKARDIVNMCKLIVEKFNSKVPSSMDELLELPGVGRKTANLIIGDIFGKPAVVVDTHCIRITKRLGFHNLKEPTKIENILRKALPPDESNNFCHRLVLHGRAVCKASRPLCENCCMNSFCRFYKQSDDEKII